MSEHENINKIRTLIDITEAENSDFVTNAEIGLKKLRSLGLDGRIIFVNDDNHAYLIPNTFPNNELAVNPPTKVQVGDDPATLVQFDNYTIEQLLEMVKDGRANDITNIK